MFPTRLCPTSAGRTLGSVALVAASLSLAPSASAEIGLTDGHWSTTFDCSVWASDGPLACDGLEIQDNSWVCTTENPPKPTEITSEANHPAGDGGMGMRKWVGPGHNISSQGLSVRFDPPQPEIWLRWVTRFEDGFYWTGVLKYHKIIYAFTDGTNAANVNFPQGDDDVAVELRNSGNPDLHCSSCGWASLFGSATSDGSWHCFEVHMALNGIGADDGIFRMWVDGQLILDHDDVDYRGSYEDATGWSDVTVGSNNDSPGIEDRCSFIDYDDFAVAIPSYGDFEQDGSGHQRIGCTMAGTGAGGAGGSGTAGAGQGATGTGGGAAAGAGGNAGQGADGGLLGAPPAGSDSSSCACRAAPTREGSAGLSIAAFFALAARLRRRRPADVERR